MPDYVFAAEGYLDYDGLGVAFVPGDISDGGMAYWGEAAVS